MANETPNYHLQKPLPEDFYDIDVQNGNMDVIDTELKQLEDDKVTKIAGKQLSTNDFTTPEKTKLQGIATAAQVNVLEKAKANGGSFDTRRKQDH